jgi:Ca-activated chloride channel family protein
MEQAAALLAVIFIGAMLLPGCAFAATVAMANPVRPQPSMELNDRSLPPLHLKSHIVTAQINGRVARVVAESTYHNDTQQQLEAIYTFPLPEGAAVDRFVMWMDGKEVEAQVAEKNLAAQTYESIVHRKKDPGLMEQVSANVFRFRIFPVMPGADQKVRMEYSHVLPLAENGTVLHFDYPLQMPSPRDASSEIARNFVVSVKLEMESPIASLESTTHAISSHIRTEDPRQARASIEMAHAALDKDFSLKVTMQNKAAPVSVLAYRPASMQGNGEGEDGTMMLMVTPEQIEGQELPAKDVVMIMDVSGSMAGVKIEQAKAALRTCLSRLRPGDRFAIESFSDDVTPYKQDWEQATPETIQGALAFVNRMVAGGSTNIEDAIHRALAYKGEPGRLRQILFATDGEPTIGETNIHTLAEMTCKRSKDNPENVDTRFFTFGIGYDVNTVLLDKIASLTHGDRAYVRPEEDIARKVADLCDKIQAPALTDVTFSFSQNLSVQHIYPPQLGDLYFGRQAVLTASYKTAGTGSVTIKGRRAGKEVVIEAPVVLPESTPQATSFLPKQWAIRKVGYLLDHMHLNGEVKELKEEVIHLGTKYGIVTPYTSYLALESQDQARVFGARRPTPHHDTPPTDPTSRESSDIVVPPDIVAKAQLGDHFEAINPDRADVHSAYGNPDAHIFHNNVDTSPPGGGGMEGLSLDDLIGVGGAAGKGTGGGWGGADGTGIGVGSGKGSFGYREGGGRKLLVKRNGGSAVTEEAVERALSWLAFHQEADGHWDSAKFGVADADTGVSALALLAFVGAGHTEKVGQYKDNVQRAVAWLKSKQNANGAIGPAGTMGAINDQHILTAMALSEAAGMSNIRETREAAQKAIDFLTAKDDLLSNAQLGIQSMTERSTFSLSWYLTSLKSAKVAGLRVKHEAFEAAIKFLDSCEQKTGDVSRFGAKRGGQPDIHATAAALFCRQLLGWPVEELQPSVEALIKDAGNVSWTSSDLNYWYWGTLCAFQQGGEVWKNWNDAMKKSLIENQNKQGDDAGSWTITGADAQTLGKVGQTALCGLCLETYYRYMSLQNHGVSSSSPAPAPQVQPVQPSTPAPAPAPAQSRINFSKADTGQEAVDYSEYIRKMKEGIEPGK